MVYIDWLFDDDVYVYIRIVGQKINVNNNQHKMNFNKKIKNNKNKKMLTKNLKF